jgi:hypothetical protein
MRYARLTPAPIRGDHLHAAGVGHPQDRLLSDRAGELARVARLARHRYRLVR